MFERSMVRKHASPPLLASDQQFPQMFVADQLKGRITELASFTKLIIRAKSDNPQSVKIKVALIDADASSNASFITLNQQFSDLEIPLNSLLADSVLLLPRPYPSFMPLWFKAAYKNIFKLNQLDKIEVSFTSNQLQQKLKNPQSIEVEFIKLVK